MKKIMKVLSLTFIAVMLAACSVEKVEKTYTKKVENKGIVSVQTIKISGTADDFLNRVEITTKYDFSNKKATDKGIKETKSEIKKIYEGTKNNVTEYSKVKFIKGKNNYEIKQVMDYEKAREDKKPVFKGEYLGSKEYYSFTKAIKAFVGNDYKEVT